MNSARKEQAVVVLCLLTVVCPCAFALNPSLDINQYAHTAWLVRDGFPQGNIRSIAQSPDGYLWLGTEFGLVRFDGIKNVSWTPPAGQRLPSNNIRSLVAARDGTLWIGTLEGLASWKNGKLTLNPELAKQNVYTLLEDRDGTIWAGTFGVPAGRLCQIRGAAVTCHGQDGSIGQWVESLYEDSHGRVWAGTMTGLWRWRPGPPEHSSLAHSIDSAQAVAEDDNRSGVIALADVLWHVVDGTARKYPLGGVRGPLTPIHMLRDRDGGLWIGTLQRGLLHLYRGRTDLFSRRDGLSGDNVLSLFEDREGNVWVATAGGLDRFHNVVAPSISLNQGLSSPSTMTALVAHDGSIWTSTLDGLNRWNKGEVSIYRAHAAPANGRLPDYSGGARSVREVIDSGLADNEPGSLFEDEYGRVWVSSTAGISRFQNDRFTRVNALPGGWVNAMAGDRKHGVWIAYQDQGLYHLVQDKVVEQIAWAKLGHTVASSMVVDPDIGPNRGGLWLGFFDGGVVHFDRGQVLASYGEKDGLGSGRVMDLRFDDDGALWAATEGGLSRVKDGRVITLNSRNGLPCDGVHWAVEDSASSFWLYTTCGLLRVARSELQGWTSQPRRKIERIVFDASDGVGLKALLTGYTPRVSKSADGKIWFAHFDSISVIDPLHLEFNDVPPPVHVEQITADGKMYDSHRGGSLPALVRNVTIDYTALSLVAPEKVHFRYQLEGQDPDWREVLNDREVQYSNLPPGSYRFHVKASNNSGVWNETGDTLEFSVAPAYYQTTWFYASCVPAFLAMVWGLYRLRLYQIQREFNAQLDGRVEERLRVARELHDTLLQSFQASLIRMQAARNMFARRPEKAVESLDDAISTAAGAVAEGRSAIQDLRDQPARGGDLPKLLTAAGQELAHSAEAPGKPPAFSVTVEGARQDLEPVLQDEVYRIGRELLRNAFRHAQAGRIEVEIRYESRQFRLHVRDDGKGFDPEILPAGGRAGHFGLPGMRERVDRFGGKLEFWSESGAGTEARLTVPAAAAYANSNVGAFSFLRRGKADS